MELTKHALLDRMIGDPESPESPESPQVVSPESPIVIASIHEGYVKKFQSKDQNEIGFDAVCDNCREEVKIEDFKTADALELFCCGSGNDEGFCQACQDAESPKDQHQKAQESYLTERAAMWLSFGYSREECIDFVTGEGYSKPFAVKIVDQAFGRISETEGNTEIQ